MPRELYWSYTGKKAHLTDECAEFTGTEAIIDTREDGNSDYNIAEETSEVVKGVHPN